ncbi:MAG: AAA family ATPase, partial [Nitrospinae bacterium]|nr:AAA family ATPase [Nitrospinota bacterium]
SSLLPELDRGEKKNRQRNMYQEYFGFSEKPFDLTPDPKYLYLSPKHKEVLAHLVYGMQENNGFLKIVGEVGTGKTTICRSFLRELRGDFHIAYIFNPCVNALELLQAINVELGLPADSASKKELTDHLNHFLLEQRKSGHRVAVIIDEAQDLDPAVLEQLRLLSNLETETEKLIQIVLIGQPELDKHLAKEELRQLRQRITIQWELLPLNLEETRGYLQHRLNVAKGKGKVHFAHRAFELIYEYSKGIPRMINVLADRTLLIAYTLGVKKVSGKIVHRAAKDVGGLTLPPSWTRMFWKGMVPAILLGGAVYSAVNWISIPKLNSASGKDIRETIREDPLDFADSGKLIPGNPSPANAPLDPAGEAPARGKPAAAEAGAPGATAPGPEGSTRMALDDALSDRRNANPPSPLYKGEPHSASAPARGGVESSVTLGREQSEPGHPAPQKTGKAAGSLAFSKTESVVTYLSSLSYMDSRVAAAKWLLKSWNVLPENLAGVDGKIFDRLEKDYGLLPFELNGDFKRLLEFNYPALLELTLPNSQGVKYLALTQVKGDTGVFGSADAMEVPLSAVDPLWNRKAIIFWEDFEQLPQKMELGFKGKESVWLQKNLRLLGFFQGLEAAVYGQKTADAVLKFQRKYNIKDDGKFDAESKIMLYNLLNIYSVPKLVSP